MESLVAQNGEYIVLALFLVEWFLGNTKLVKANSSVSLVLEGLKKVLSVFKPKEK
jgi:hypothetical protein